MAHPKEKRRQLRGLFVHQRLPMETACKQAGVPVGTGKRWKQEALAEGDDWDSARAAVAMGDESFAVLSKQLLEDYLVQHQATIDLLRKDDKMQARERAETLASMSDSFNKTMNAFRRLSPEINRQAVALDTLKALATFTQQKFPQHVPVLLELLEPFGTELAKAG